jgi:hypothetical protein
MPCSGTGYSLTDYILIGPLPDAFDQFLGSRSAFKRPLGLLTRQPRHCRCTLPGRYRRLVNGVMALQLVCAG